MKGRMAMLPVCILALLKAPMSCAACPRKRFDRDAECWQSNHPGEAADAMAGLIAELS